MSSSKDPTPAAPAPEPREPDAVDALEPDLEAWLDRQLPPQDAARFEARLSEDPEKAKEAKTLAQVLATLRTLPRDAAPNDLIRGVENDIRARSKGRYFGYHWKHRFPYEALVSSVLLVFALIVWVSSSQPAPPLMAIDPKPFVTASSDLGVAARLLGDYGTFRHDKEIPEDANWVHVVGDVETTRMEALRSEVSLYPSMRMDGEEPLGQTTRVRIAIRK